MRNRSRVQRLAWWNRVSESPLVAASVLFLVAFSWQVLGRLGPHRHTHRDLSRLAEQLDRIEHRLDAIEGLPKLPL